MNRIRRRFRDLRSRGEKALVLYLTAGDPSLGKTLELIPALEEAGADLVEIGVPFSDPTADGPVIQAASQRSLGNGTTLAEVIDLTAELRRNSEIPIILFSYYNPIWVFGPERFAAAAKNAGADGVLVVDLPPEEAGELRKFTDPQNLDFIPLVSPTTGEARRRMIVARAQGFLYYISIVGITGTAAPEGALLRSEMALMRKITDLPLVVGFGLSKPGQARTAAQWADGVVVGSALVQRIHDFQHRKDLTRQVGVYVRQLKRALSPTP
jgi:tryptophan synthase alpha chain